MGTIKELLHFKRKSSISSHCRNKINFQLLPENQSMTCKLLVMQEMLTGNTLSSWKHFSDRNVLWAKNFLQYSIVLFTAQRNHNNYVRYVYVCYVNFYFIQKANCVILIGLQIDSFIFFFTSNWSLIEMQKVLRVVN